MHPKISVIMPVYNSEKYLFQSIDSILTQTFSDFEFIIIDDGSTDNSLNIINSFTDNRIKVISNKINLGISQTLNKGIKLSSGDYIARMDSDDISFNNRLEKQFYFMESNEDISICGCNMDYIIQNKFVSKKTSYSAKDSEIKTDMLFGKTPFAHPTIMIRGSFIRTNNVKYNVKVLYAEDLDLYCRFYNVAKYANLKEQLHFYRIHENSVSIQHKMQQCILARSIVSCFLKNEGLRLSAKEFDIHCSLYLPIDDNLNIDQNDLLSWSKKIKSFAYHNHKYDNEYFYYLIDLLYKKCGEI